MKKLFTLILICSTVVLANAQVTMNENFNYGSNTDSLTGVAIAAGTWFGHSGAAPVMYLNTGLAYSGYPSSGVGGAAFGQNSSSSRQDVNRAIGAVYTSGSIYASFLFNVKFGGGTTGDYFFHFNDSAGATIGGNFRAKMWLKDTTGGKISIGLTKGLSTVANVVWSAPLDTSVTYLIVVKYVYIPGTTNDSCYSYIFNSGVPNKEPVATLAATDLTQTDLSKIKSVCIRQGSVGTMAQTIDGIRVGANWGEVVAGITPGPAPVSNLSAAATGQTTMNLSWTKDASYVDSNLTTLVFLKKINPVIVGIPTKGPGAYIPNPVYPGGTAYQNDSLARCVFKGDGNGVGITGLTASTNYQVMVLVVRDGDSTFSNAMNASGTTNGAIPPPLPVKSLFMNFPTPYTANVTYGVDTSYKSSTMSILAFLKKGTVITIGTPVKNPSVYTANSDFSVGGTAYENDAQAKCVYNGDSLKFSVTGLTAKTFYTVLLLVVRDGDSAWSSSSIFIDSTSSYKPAAPFNFKFSNMGLTTATLSWIKPAPYIDSTMTTLVFLKLGSGIIGGNMTQDPATFTANSNFGGTASTYPFDTVAKCVYNSDSDNVQLTGLLPNTLYYALAYTVRKADSSYYSSSIFTNNKTLSYPSPATSVQFNASGQTSATIKWTKPAGYITLDYQTIVFLKEVNPVNAAKPVNNAGFYVANSDWSIGGTPNENDSMAEAVFNGDTNFVNITGLTLGTTYHAMVFIVRTPDSAYSTGASGSGSTFGAVLPPNPVFSTNSNNTGSTTGVVAWVKDSSYNDSAMTILVFAKKGSPVIQGTPTKPASSYTANADFSLNGTLYEHDTLAKCVYSGDDIKVSLTGLQALTQYQFLIYVVRNNDSAYSTAKTTSFTTQVTPPAAVTGIQVKGISLSSATILWTKPAGYNNATSSTLVVVKENSAVNAGTPTKPITSYASNTVFGLGTKYQNDSSAYTVFKADTNFVTVTNLKRGITYHVLIYTLRDADSVYSPDAAGSGTVLAQPAVSPIGVISTVNMTTGNPDSINVKVRVRGVAYGYNQRPTGLQFVVRDNTGGITLFRTTGNFGYTTYAEGDSVEAEGSVATFRGLAEINLDTIIVLGTGKALKVPTKVNTVVESGENDLLKIDSVKFISVPPGGFWPTASSNVSVTNQNNDTIVLRVLNISGLAGKPLPLSPTFSVVGLGVQFSTSPAAPFAFNGYQLFPRWQSDIMPNGSGDTLDHFRLLAPATNTVIPVVNDTAAKATFSWSTAKTNVTGITVHYTIVMDTFSGNFSSPKFSIMSGNSGMDTIFTIPVAAIGAGLGLAPGQNYKAKWLVIAQAGSFKRVADSAFTITFTKAALPLDTLLPFALLTPVNNATQALQGDTAADVVFNWRTSVSTVSGITADYTFVLDTFGGNFTSPKIIFSSDNSGLDTILTMNVVELSNALGLSMGMTYKAQWGVIAHGGSFLRNSTTVNTITFNRGMFMKVNEAEAGPEISVYPNPASQFISINSGTKQIEEAKLMDVTGRIIELALTGTTGTYHANVDFCMPGIYFLQLKYGSVTTKQKIVITR